MNIIGKRYLFFALSLIIIIPGLIILAVNGLPLALDFTGGSLLEISWRQAIFLNPRKWSLFTPFREFKTPRSKPPARTL